MCPHCRTDHMGLRVVAAADTGKNRGVAHVDCPKCQLPSCATVRGDGKIPINDWGAYAGDIAGLGWEVADFWPPIAGPVIPENLPLDVERIYLAAERNFPTEGNEEPAGAMYRKALDVGLKKIDPEAKGVRLPSQENVEERHNMASNR